jgi:hypothetical protein
LAEQLTASHYRHASHGTTTTTTFSSRFLSPQRLQKIAVHLKKTVNLTEQVHLTDSASTNNLSLIRKSFGTCPLNV